MANVKNMQSPNAAGIHPGRWVALVSSIFQAVGSISTWGSVLAVDLVEISKVKEVTIRGIGGKDGIFILMVAILTFILLLIKKVPLWVPLFLGISGLIVGVADLIAMSETTAALKGKMGIGIYITVLASAGIIIGTLTEFVSTRFARRS